MDSKVKKLPEKDMLRLVSNFGNGDCGVGEIHKRARNFGTLRLLEISRARGVFHPPHNRHRQN